MCRGRHVSADGGAGRAGAESRDAAVMEPLHGADGVPGEQAHGRYISVIKPLYSRQRAVMQPL